MTPQKPDSIQQRERERETERKEFSWLCSAASISLTVVKNNAESGPEGSFLLGFLPLACCQPQHATKHGGRSPPRPSLTKGGRRYVSFNGSHIPQELGDCVPVLAPALLSCVSLSVLFNSEPWFLHLSSPGSEPASPLRPCSGR